MKRINIHIDNTLVPALLVQRTSHGLTHALVNGVRVTVRTTQVSKPQKP